MRNTTLSGVRDTPTNSTEVVCKFHIVLKTNILENASASPQSRTITSLPKVIKQTIQRQQIQVFYWDFTVLSSSLGITFDKIWHFALVPYHAGSARWEQIGNKSNFILVTLSTLSGTSS